MDEPKLTARATSKGFAHVRPEEELRFTDAHVVGEDFSKRRKARHLSATGSRFERCMFERLKLDTAMFGLTEAPSSFTECSFDGARISGSAKGTARFERCTFKGVVLRDWFCFEIELIDCVFTGSMTHSVINGRPNAGPDGSRVRERNEIAGNDLTDMELRDVGFRTGVDLSKQRLPSGPEYLYIPDAASAIAYARQAILPWEDLDLRARTLRLLDHKARAVADGQEQLLLRWDEPATNEPAEREAWTLLLRLLGGQEV